MIPVMIAAAALATATPPHGYTEVKRLDLSRAFHTKTSWTMKVYQPTDPDAETGDKPVQVCLTGGRDGRTNCEKIEARGYVFQTLVSAAVEPLSASAGVDGVVVRAAFSGGAHTLTRTAIWTYNGSGLADGFLQTSAFDLSDLGEEQRFASGPLDGFYMRADSVDTYAGETYWSDHRFSISVYRLDPSYGGSGYLQVLQYVSASRYPAERDDAHYVVERELPRVRALLHTIYPDGPPS